VAHRLSPARQANGSVDSRGSNCFAPARLVSTAEPSTSGLRPDEQAVAHRGSATGHRHCASARTCKHGRDRQDQCAPAPRAGGLTPPGGVAWPTGHAGSCSRAATRTSCASCVRSAPAGPSRSSRRWRRLSRVHCQARSTTPRREEKLKILEKKFKLDYYNLY